MRGGAATAWVAVRGVLRRPGRSFLSLLGIAVASATWIVLVTLSRAFVLEMQETVSFLGTDLTVQQAGVAMPGNSWLERAQLDALRGVPHVARVYEVAIVLARGPSGQSFYLFGIGPRFDGAPGLRLLSGRALGDDPAGMMLGDRAARRLGLADGQPFEIRRRQFAVTGVFRTGRGLLDSGAIVPLAAAQEIFRLGDRANIAFLQLDEADRRAEVAAALETRWPELEVSPSDIWVSTYRQVEVAERFARVLAAVALLVAALGVSNLLAIGVIERSPQIGLLRAVGWRRSQVAATVLVEALVLGSAGAILAWPLAEAMLAVLRDLYDSAGLFGMQVGWVLRLEGAGLTVVAAAAGAVPALMLALRIAPAQAMRTLS